MTPHVDAHKGLHSEQGALRGEHPGRSRNPLIKVRDLAWLEFEKPDLVRAEAFARAFGFTTVLHTADELYLRGTDAGSTCVIVRRGSHSRFVGPAFAAQDKADVERLASATGRTTRTLPEAIGGVAVELTDPSGIPVRVVAGMHELAELAAQQPRTFNFGHELRRTNATQRPPREPARVQRLGHVVLQSTQYLQTLDWYLDHLGLIVSDFMYYPGQRDRGPTMSFIRLRPRIDAHRPPHTGVGVGPVEPLCALRLSDMRSGRDCGRRRISARVGLSPVVGDRQAYPGQPDLRLLA